MPFILLKAIFYLQCIIQIVLDPKKTMAGNSQEDLLAQIKTLSLLQTLKVQR